jgi:hypothetical protein
LSLAPTSQGFFDILALRKEIRSDATLRTLKDKLGLPESASLNDVRKELKKSK